VLGDGFDGEDAAAGGFSGVVGLEILSGGLSGGSSAGGWPGVVGLESAPGGATLECGFSRCWTEPTTDGEPGVVGLESEPGLSGVVGLEILSGGLSGGSSAGGWPGVVGLESAPCLSGVVGLEPVLGLTGVVGRAATSSLLGSVDGGTGAGGALR